MSCGDSPSRSMHVLGTHGRSHVLVPGSTNLEVALHRRAPMEQTATIFYDWRKGDDAAAITTSLRLGFFESTGAASWALQAKASALLDVAPLALKVPTLWDWGSSARVGRQQQQPPQRQEQPNPWSALSLMKAALPEQVAVLHMAPEATGHGAGDHRGGSEGVPQRQQRALLVTLQHLGGDTADASVDLEALFSVPLDDVEEMGLTFSYSAAEVEERMRWPVDDDGSGVAHAVDDAVAAKSAGEGGGKVGVGGGAEGGSGCLKGTVMTLARGDVCALRLVVG